jgi:hypothetical protein
MFRDNPDRERHMENYDEFLDDVKKEAKKIYDDVIKGRSYSIKIDNISLNNVDTYNKEKSTGVDIYVKIEGLEPFRIEYNFINYNTYSLNYISFEEEEIDYTKDLGRLQWLVDAEYMATESMYLQLKAISESLIESLWDDYENRDGVLNFAIALEDGNHKVLYDRLVKLFKKGIKIESCSFVNDSYSVEDRCIKGEIVLVLTDKKDNKVILNQDYTGLTFRREKDDYSRQSIRYAVDKDSEVIGEGLEGVNNKDLEKLFRLEKRKKTSK